MLLKPVPDCPETLLFHQLVSESNLVCMGVYRVLYGYRVRAGFYGESTVYLDWCGGGKWEDVERLYSLAFAILSRRPEDRKCFSGLPSFSLVKPFYKDDNFLKIVSREAGDFELMKLERAFQ